MYMSRNPHWPFGASLGLPMFTLLICPFAMLDMA